MMYKYQVCYKGNNRYYIAENTLHALTHFVRQNNVEVSITKLDNVNRLTGFIVLKDGRLADYIELNRVNA